jgi:type IV pilus assembly protein PilV
MSSRSRQRGVSLIEVMIAVLIFSVAVLGIALLQLKGAQFTKQSGVRTVAVLQARSLADAMQANPAGVYGVGTVAEIAALNGDVSGSYYAYNGTTAPTTVGCPNDACKQAKLDLIAWLAQLQQVTVPVNNGTSTPALATVTPNTASGLGTVTVAVSWNGLIPNQQTGLSNDESYQFDFQPSLSLQAQ